MTRPPDDRTVLASLSPPLRQRACSCDEQPPMQRATAAATHKASTLVFNLHWCKSQRTGLCCPASPVAITHVPLSKTCSLASGRDRPTPWGAGALPLDQLPHFNCADPIASHEFPTITFDAMMEAQHMAFVICIPSAAHKAAVVHREGAHLQGVGKSVSTARGTRSA